MSGSFLNYTLANVQTFHEIWLSNLKRVVRMGRNVGVAFSLVC